MEVWVVQKLKTEEAEVADSAANGGLSNGGHYI